MAYILLALHCLVSTLNGHHKNPLRRASASTMHETKQAGQQGSQAFQFVFLPATSACSLKLIFAN
jgi:hypothetical protein